MNKFEGVANTLFVPLVARINISKKFPEYRSNRGQKKVLGQRKGETLIAGDMFKLEWVKEIDKSLPTLLIVSGVFQYFHEEKIIAFIKACGKAFTKGEMLFDATSESGLKFTNWFIKRTGNASAIMYFGINDSKEFADKCDMQLLEEKSFFPDALQMLGKKLGFVTKVSMKIAEKKKQVKILRLKLNQLIVKFQFSYESYSLGLFFQDKITLYYKYD